MNQTDPPHPVDRMTSQVFAYRAKIRDVLNAEVLDLTVDCGFGLRYQPRVRVAGIDCDPIQPEGQDPTGRQQAVRAVRWVKSAREQFDGDWPFVVRTLRAEGGQHATYRADVHRRDTGGSLQDHLLEEYPNISR